MKKQFQNTSALMLINSILSKFVITTRLLKMFVPSSYWYLGIANTIFRHVIIWYIEAENLTLFWHSSIWVEEVKKCNFVEKNSVFSNRFFADLVFKKQAWVIVGRVRKPIVNFVTFYARFVFSLIEFSNWPPIKQKSDIE